MQTSLGSVAKKPDLNGAYPVWWNSQAIGMRAAHYEKIRSVIIGDDTAQVKITPCDAAYPGTKDWFVDFEIKHFPGMGEVDKGRRILTTADLEAAFGLSDVCSNEGMFIILRYGGDVAEQGKYIRYKDYLCIPTPGTGHDGDSVISVYLNDEIRAVMREFLALQK